MATAKLHALLQTRCLRDSNEGGYLLFVINRSILSSFCGESCFAVPVYRHRQTLKCQKIGGIRLDFGYFYTSSFRMQISSIYDTCVQVLVP